MIFFLSVVIISTINVNATRIQFKDFKIKDYKDHIELIFDYSGDYIEILQPILPSYIPDGFEVDDYTVGNTSVFYRYEDKDGHDITFEQIRRSDYRGNLDNEHSWYEKIYLKGHEEALLGHHSGSASVVFYNDEYVFEIFADLPLEEIIKMAESINY